ncbi:MAG: TetR/AcrR family transcriptional regulator [Oscillospiraceae bacterium]|nr:TetR/AcrR family transcriptional regulator [Oscillospiraceae bacterium]
MYCGSNPTALASQIQISEALIRLMEAGPYSQISVTALCKEAGISRQTFYSLFSSMENVVLFTLQEKVCQLPHEETAHFSLEGLSRIYSRYICSNRAFLKLLVENEIVYLLYNSVYASFSGCCECLGAMPERERQYAAHFLAGGLTGVVREYCDSEPPASADALYDMLLRLFSGRIFPEG